MKKIRDSRYYRNYVDIGGFGGGRGMTRNNNNNNITCG